MNTDFGAIEELPFDIRHRRPYAYSLKENEKSNVRKDIRDIISSTVMNIVENGKRSKGTFSEHYLGICNFEKDLVEKKLIPFRISELGGYNYLRETYLTQCKGLIEAIVFPPKGLVTTFIFSTDFALKITLLCLTTFPAKMLWRLLYFLPLFK